MSNEQENNGDLAESINAIFYEKPDALEQHPVNYLEYLGSILRRYRRGLEDRDQRSASGFGEKLGEYLGKPIGRRTISRTEKGDHTVSWGVLAAYLCEMNAWPDVIEALEDSNTNNLRYLILIEKEIKTETDKAKTDGISALNKRYNKYR